MEKELHSEGSKHCEVQEVMVPSENTAHIKRLKDSFSKMSTTKIHLEVPSEVLLEALLAHPQ